MITWQEGEMHRRYALLGLLASLSAAPALADGGLKFQYTIERASGDTVSETTFLQGFDTRDALRLKLRLGQPSYCYVLMSGENKHFRLAFPDDTRQGLPANQWARVPKTTFFRLSEDLGVGRVYIIVARQRVTEIESALAQGGEAVSETLALQVRDRYQGPGSYTRVLDGSTVSVRFQGRSGQPSVVVEEVALRARE